MSPDSYRAKFGDGRRRAGAVFGYSGRAYDAGRVDSRELGSWQPALSSPDAEILPSRDKIVARARDVDRNNGWVNGGTDTRSDAVVGAKIRLEARPDFEAMGRSADWAEQWAVRTEAQFRVWSTDSRFLCDVERDFQFGGVVRLAYMHYVIDGEAYAAIYDLPRGGTYQTSVLVIDPDRISNAYNAADTQFLRGGIHLDANGAEIAYDVRVQHPGDINGTLNAFRWETVQREGPTGRPRMVHVKSKRRAQQRKGVSAIASSLKRTKMLDRYDNAELEAALWNAINAFVIESQYSDKDVSDALAPAGDDDEESGSYWRDLINFRSKNRIGIGGGIQGLHLLPGEKASMLQAERPAGNFAAFESAVLRSIASTFKLSYPQLSQDWAGINYSSARTLLNETWRGLLTDRHLFTQGFCAPIYAAWLEEAIALGKVKVPGGPMNFYRYRAELTASEWIGPGRGVVDPVKESTSADMDLVANRRSLQMQCAEQGTDVRDVMLQRQREIRMAERLGLPPAQPVAKPLPVDPTAHPDAADHADQQEAAAA